MIEWEGRGGACTSFFQLHPFWTSIVDTYNNDRFASLSCAPLKYSPTGASILPLADCCLRKQLFRGVSDRDGRGDSYLYFNAYGGSLCIGEDRQVGHDKSKPRVGIQFSFPSSEIRAPRARGFCQAVHERRGKGYRHLARGWDNCKLSTSELKLPLGAHISAQLKEPLLKKRKNILPARSVLPFLTKRVRYAIKEGRKLPWNQSRSSTGTISSWVVLWAEIFLGLSPTRKLSVGFLINLSTRPF